MRHIGISQWRNVSEVNRKRGGSRGAKRSSWLFMSILIMFSEQWIAGCGICVCVIVLLSFHLYVSCKSRIDSNKVSKYSQKISSISRWPVSLLHCHHSLLSDCINIYQFICYFSSSKVKERENPPFLSTSRRRGMCTAPYIDSNAEEGNTFQNIFMACTEPFQRGITQYYLCAVIR